MTEIVLRPKVVVGGNEEPYDLDGQLVYDYCFQTADGAAYRVPVHHSWVTCLRQPEPA
jgi:hypothetical protein